MHDATTAKPHARMRLSFDRAALFALTITTVLALVVFTVSPSVSFFGTKVFVLMIGTLIAFALYIVARLIRGNVIIPPSLLLGAVWLVPFAYALSTLFSGASSSLAFFGVEFETHTFGFVLLLALFASLFALAPRREGEYAFFFKIGSYALGLTVVAQAALILGARVAPNAIAPLSNLVGSFSDMGMVVGLGVIGSLLALRFLALSGAKRVLLWIGIVLGFMLLALVNSTLIWVLISLVALGLLIEVLMRRKPAAPDSDLEGVATMSIDAEDTASENRPIGPPLVTLLLALFFLISGSTIGNALASALGTSFIDVRPSWQSTFDVGSHTYASSPLFGSGPGTFGEQWLMHRDRALNDTIFWNVDFTSGIGYIPTSMVTTGILGTIAWLAFVGMFLFVGVRTLLFRLPQERLMRFVAMFSFLGSAYALVLAIFSSPGPVVLAIGFAFIGLFISSLRYGKDRVEWGVIFSRNPRIGFAIVFSLTILLIGSVFAAYAVTTRYLASLAYGEAGAALSKGDLAAADSAVSRSLSFAATDRTYRLATAAGIAHMNGIVSSKTLAPSDAQQQFQTALSATIQSATAATRLAPNNYQNWLVLGNVYQAVVPLKIDGAAEQAAAAYEKAGALAPTNPAVPYTLAQLEIVAADYPAAEARLLEAIALKRDYTQAILLLSQLQIQLGKASEALQAVEAAIYFSPNDPATLFQAGILRLGTGDKAGAIQALGRAVELNPQYANARFFLAAADAASGDTAGALAELKAVAALSPENADAVADDIKALEAGQNPYPQARLRTLGVPYAPVAEPAPKPETAE